ncbi:hypothetical protein, conserved [Entamoeba dispar SAW760]|uniref:AIG1-type G domain-containing protein n=1 Tax=Entamoeba dispar (strain ATCC PRA-260 / SAW760) TaxID=370354 RepID=B0ENX6_ENTDS|nr:uncharacterized protein EDI_185330 [Entamoeba dispar SAW760]EDR23771.1 hypothetical protein, conserved [Entamoeba dispar SAW760]|eukprot:EDR23771.1 hypothetical protein, conserved [Entamoeba dispar SAW760]
MSTEGSKQTKLLLIGETGTGKSSLGNFILKKNVFMACESPNSVTKKTDECSGKGDRSDVFVVDTPGLNDSNNFDNINIQNIIECVKKTGLQGIVLTMDFNNPRFSHSLKHLVKVISDVFQFEDIWKHVCIVWTRCYDCFPSFMIENSKIEKKKFKEEIIKFIKQTNKINENIDIEKDIPMYYVDSQLLDSVDSTRSEKDDDTRSEKDDSTRSEKEIKKLIEWAKKLKLIDKEEINKSINEFKEIEYEEKEEREIIEETKDTITYKITKYIRPKKIKYNEEFIYGEITETSSRTITEKKSNKKPKKSNWIVVGVIVLGVVVGAVVGGGIGGGIGAAVAAGAVINVAAGAAAGVGAIGGGVVGAIGGGTIFGFIGKKLLGDDKKKITDTK